MKDSLGGILYVGKAKNLKNRVQSYFRSSANHSSKIQKLVRHLKDFDIILTDTEFEAFLLECKLIKQLKPPYNRQMKNPLSYCYIAIEPVGLHRKIEIKSHRVENDGKLYFGPFTKVKTVEKTLTDIKETFRILCSNPVGKGSACLNYSLGMCCGICLGDEKALEQYHMVLDKFIALLSRKDSRLMDEMIELMEQAAENFDFETAAKLRNRIEAVQFLLYKEKVIDFTSENNKVVVMEKLDEDRVKLFLIQGIEVVFSKIFLEENLQVDALKGAVLASFKRCETPRWLTRDEMDQAQIIYRYLNSNEGAFLVILDQWLFSDYHDELHLALEGFINKNFKANHIRH
ncbi:UvrB/UvrC motif-containing protein [Pseudoneobacillus sp. C159]